MTRTEKELRELRRLCRCADLAIETRRFGGRSLPVNAAALKALRRAWRLLKKVEPEAAKWEREK